MATVSVANTDSGLSGKTIDLLESDQTITGLKTFSRGAQTPFAVAVGSTVVTNLNADQVDGVDVVTLVANRIPYAASASSLTNGSGLTFDGTTFTAATNTLTAALFTIPGGQIAFPAVQVPSTGANVLDDYEENSFTPAITGTSGSGITYSAQVGRYTKIGKRVQFYGQITLTAIGTAAGSASLTGLPFTSENVSGVMTGTLHFGYWNIATAMVYVGGIIPVNVTTCDLYGATGALATSVAVTIANLGAAANIHFSGSYMASA